LKLLRINGLKNIIIIIGMKFKYPRTFHLPWSLGRSRDDLVLDSIDHFIGKEVVVTEKLDGENTTLYRESLHARSLDSKSHPSRNWLKQLHGQISHNIPEGWRMCGENLYAKHSIKYTSLPSYFLVFGIYNDKNCCLSWKEIEEWCELIGLITVPILYKGFWDEEMIKKCFTGISKFGGEQEGYIVRISNEFPFEDFKINTAKFVRQGHVSDDDEHWMYKEMEPNTLK